MGKSALLAILLPLALAAIAVPAWAVLSYKAPPPTVPTQIEPLGPAFRAGKIAAEPKAGQLAQWRKLADASCKCVRRGGDSAECWAAYDRQTAAYSKSDGATMCMPVAHSYDCFGEGDGFEKCVEIDRDHAGPLLCSNEERRAVEMTWNTKMAGINDKSEAETNRIFAEANAAIERVYQRILRGESLAGIKGPAGCGG